MEEQVRLAVNSALAGNWKAAIAANLALLKQNSKDIDALNRLGRAYFETGQKTKAEEVYAKVLRNDKFNSIALKSLDLLKTSRMPKKHTRPDLTGAPPPVFLEEPGITKTVTLNRPGDPKVVSRLHPGDLVTVVARDHIVCITSLDNLYLGRLPDDLASRLLPLLKSGNRYHAWIRSLDAGVKVFIKEVYKNPKFKDVTSFPSTEKLSYAAFTPPELVHSEKPDVSGTEEQDDAAFSDDTEDTPPEPLERPQE